MDSELEPLTTLASSLLAEERRRPPLAAADVEALWARISATLGPGDGGGESGAEGGRGGRGTSGISDPSAVSARTLAWIGAAFVVGAGAGAAIHARLASPVERVVTVTVPAAARSSSSLVEPSTPTDGSVPIESLPVARPIPPTARAVAPRESADEDPRPHDEALSQERAIIERARMALARGDTGAVLDAVAAHERTFPSGRLREEREALATRALAASGRIEEARARAERFHASYPKSLFWPALDALVTPH